MYVIRINKDEAWVCGDSYTRIKDSADVYKDFSIANRKGFTWMEKHGKVYLRRNPNFKLIVEKL